MQTYAKNIEYGCIYMFNINVLVLTILCSWLFDDAG